MDTVAPKRKRPRKFKQRTVAESVAQETRDHVITADLVQSHSCVAIRYGNRDGSSIFAFKLVWVPQHIFIAGDIGEITFTHYGALEKPISGLSWFANSTDENYLLSKSNIDKVVDQAETIKDLREMTRGAGNSGRAWRQKIGELIDTIKSGDYGPHEIPSLIYEAGGIEDYYGAHVYPRQAHFQLRMAQQAARAWLATQAVELAA
jgi:hypothetical protein